MDKGEYTVTIKRATMVMTMDRTDLVQVDQTPDGVAFSFKHGVHIIVADQFMPNECKDLIKAANAFPKGNVTFDLNNYKKPASVQL
jgi:hypothetical protein